MTSTNHTSEIDIIGVGSPIVDLLARVDDAFLRTIDGGKGGMVLVGPADIAAMVARLPAAPARSPGGSSGNTTFALARLGNRAAFLGKTGNDEAGTFYRESFARLGGRTDRFKSGAVPNGCCLSLITPDAQRTLRTDLGAAMTLAPDEITPRDFAGCRHAHIEGYLLFNPALLMRVLECARSAGCSVSLDLASYEVVEAARDALPAILRDYVDVVFANEEEATAYFGPGHSYEDMARALAGLCTIGVVKLGKAGSLVAAADSADGALHRIAPVVVADAIDTTGAGDFWAAGFLHGWLRGLPLARCGAFGSILGAAIVSVVGTQLTPERWDAIIHQFGEHE